MIIYVFKKASLTFNPEWFAPTNIIAKQSHNTTQKEPQPEMLSAKEQNAEPNNPIPEQIFLTLPTEILGQFHQHFTFSFFVPKFHVQLFCTYI